MQIKQLLTSLAFITPTIFCSSREFIIKHTSTPGRVDPIFYSTKTILEASQAERKNFEFFHPAWRAYIFNPETALLFLQYIKQTPGDQIHQTYLNTAIQTCQKTWRQAHPVPKETQDLLRHACGQKPKAIEWPFNEIHYNIALKYWRHIDAYTSALLHYADKKFIVKDKVD